MRFIAVAILVLVVASVCAAPVSAADITITFDKEQVQAKMILSVHQNMTRLPNKAITIDAFHDSNMSSAISQALRGTNSSASFSALSMGVASSATWLNVTLMMNLTGISERRGDMTYVNMTWKAFRTTADLRVGNFSYNTLGRRYLRPVVDFYVNASKFENRSNATIKAITFFNATQSVPGTQTANEVGNFTVLDFSRLSVPLGQWNRTYSLSNNTTSWRYTAPVLLNATVRVSGLNGTFTIFSRYAYNAEIRVRALALAEGDMLRVDVGSGQKEWIMIGVAVVAVVLAIVVQIMFSRRKRVVRLGRR